MGRTDYDIMHESMRKSRMKQYPKRDYCPEFHGAERVYNMYRHVYRKLNKMVGQDYDLFYSWFQHEYKNDKLYNRYKDQLNEIICKSTNEDLVNGCFVTPFLIDENNLIQRNKNHRNFKDVEKTPYGTVYEEVKPLYASIVDGIKNISRKDFYKMLENGETEVLFNMEIKSKQVLKSSIEWKRYVGSGQCRRDNELVRKLNIENGYIYWWKLNNQKKKNNDIQNESESETA